MNIYIFFYLDTATTWWHEIKIAGSVFLWSKSFPSWLIWGEKIVMNEEWMSQTCNSHEAYKSTGNSIALESGFSDIWQPAPIAKENNF